MANLSSHGVLLVAAGSILWGSSGIAGQYILQGQGISPEWLTFFRLFVADGEGHCFRLEKFSRKAAAHHLRMPRHAGDAVLLLRLHQGQQRGGRNGSRIHHAGPHHHVVLHA